MTTATEQITYTEEILMRHDEISPGVFVIGIQRTRPFKAGQSVYLSVNPDDTPRIYSICSGPNEDELCILFSVHPGGLLTPQLARMKKGDRVWISNPYGVFIIGDEPAWLIATGTGIAPFYSALSAG
ncbi:MAG: hypothetical protein FJ220_01810, partial [Kiritimatiellaceae bacterium]|nr:hypothetical protein [Kiritimatiellaceae bacterium]